MNKVLIVAATILLASTVCFAQSNDGFAQSNDGLVCISQEAANKAAENVRTIDALEEKIKVLEEAVKAKDASIAELREAARRNDADYKAALARMEADLAFVKGQLVASQAEVARQSAIITTMIPMLREKSWSLIKF